MVSGNIKLILSENTDQFESALRECSDPVVNILYATVDNNIG